MVLIKMRWTWHTVRCNINHAGKNKKGRKYKAGETQIEKRKQNLKPKGGLFALFALR